MSIENKSDPAGFETLESFSQIPAFNRWLYEKIRDYIKGDILEIGSGIGNISQFLLNDFDNVSLTDLRFEYCQVLRKKFRQHPYLRGIFELDLSVTEFADVNADLVGRFDTVIALNVVEHIQNDRLAIQNASSLLRENGRLIVLVPAGQWLYNGLDKELGHYKRYSKKTLNALLESGGLNIKESRYFNAAAIPGWWLSGTILREKIISPAKLKLFNRMVPLFKLSDWFVSPITGVSVISVGIKMK